MKKIFVLFTVLLTMSVAAFAQQTQSNVRDGIYDRHLHQEKQIIPYEHLRESDIFWQQRIWRVIDVNEKMNLPFKYPKAPLINIMLDAAYSGEVTVYDPGDDEFLTPMTPEQVKGIGASRDTILVTDPVTLEEKYEVVEQTLNWRNIKKFRLKEDWVFDEETSTMMVRIIGIAPILDKYDDNGNFMGELPMFWAYYPDLRPIFVNHETFNPFNDAKRLSWDDLFEARLFSSYIYKESNVYDRRIQDYSTGIDALLESDRIKQDIFEFEHNLWSY